jgi:hypothetical protein
MDDNTESEENSLDEFLEGNKHYLTLIGIFGAASIYLEEVSRNVEEIERSATEIEIGVFSGFGIVVISLVVLLMKMANKLVYSNYSYSEKTVLGFLTLFLGMLTYSVFEFIFEFDSIMSALAQLVTLTAGILTFFLIVDFTTSSADRETRSGISYSDLWLTLLSILGMMQYGIGRLFFDSLGGGEPFLAEQRAELHPRFFLELVSLYSTVLLLFSIILFLGGMSTIIWRFTTHRIGSYLGR